MASPLPQSSNRWLTPSNVLTGMRLVAAPIFCWTILNESYGVACAVFWLAVASDFVDGRLARARNEASVLGGLLDHGSDATFVTLGQFALAASGRVPVLLPILIVAAFVQYALDSRILAGRALRTSFLGRWNGILYFVPPGVVVTREALGLASPPDGLVLVVGWLLVVSTLVSMAGRLVGLVATARDGAPPR